MCDIGAAGDTAALVDKALARYGRLDAAFNNGGTSGGVGRLADLSEERFDELSRVNFKGIWLAMRAEIPALLRNPQAGAIVNTSSVGCLHGGPNFSAYPATKRAVIGLTTTGAHGYGRDGLRVNAIASGTTDTDMIVAWKDAIRGSPSDRTRSRRSPAAASPARSQRLRRGCLVTVPPTCPPQCSTSTAG